MNKKTEEVIIEKYNILDIVLVEEYLRKIVEDVFKDYKDPTEHMTIGQKKLFDKAFKKLVKEQYDKK